MLECCAYKIGRRYISSISILCAPSCIGFASCILTGLASEHPIVSGLESDKAVRTTLQSGISDMLNCFAYVNLCLLRRNPCAVSMRVENVFLSSENVGVG